MAGKQAPLPELLAPSGSMDSLVAAVNAGADAVYVGGKRFGARKYSANFSDEELCKALEYAHLRGARVYVTVNTLVHDRELPDVARYLRDLYAMGVDAVLIQDPGVAMLARDVVPGLPRHASTQCTITSAEGVVYAKRLDYDRVVLAREVPLHEIDRIFSLPQKKRPGIEVFLHGALCYAYSGQCLLSSVIGGRSGNRGACAQPCRRDYSLLAGTADSWGRMSRARAVPLKERCLLSTRDLCLYSKLPLLLERPFSALKIEGRMRSPDYVAVVTSIYRRALDAAASGSFVPLQSEMDLLAIAFSRGFTSGYICGDHGPSLMGRDRPDKRGLFLGTIRSCHGQVVRVAAAGGTIPAPGDGLVGIDPATRAESGFVLKSAVEQLGRDLVIRQSTGCRPGMELYLTRSGALERAAAVVRNAQGPAGRFPVQIDVTLTVADGESPVLLGVFALPGGDEVTVRLEADFVPERAGARPTTSEEITRQVAKSGGTAFRVRNLDLLYNGGLFLPVGALNRFRRQFFDQAEQALIAWHRPGRAMREAADCHLATLLPVLARKRARNARSPELAVICNETAGVIAAARAGCDRIFFEPDPGALEADLLQALAVCTERKVRFAWKWPRVQVPEFTARALSLLPGLARAGLEEVMTEGAMYADPICSIVPRMRVSGGPDLHVFNAASVRSLFQDCSSVLLSPELSGDAIADLCSHLGEEGEVGVIVQGSIPAMITADPLLDLAKRQGDPGRLLHGISDATGRIFPVHPDPWGRTHILNAAELCLIDYLPALARAGVDRVVIDARWRGPSYASGMNEVYRAAMEDPAWWEGKGRFSERLPALKARIKAMAQGGITAGHYLHGLSD